MILHTKVLISFAKHVQFYLAKINLSASLAEETIEFCRRMFAFAIMDSINLTTNACLVEKAVKSAQTKIHVIYVQSMQSIRETVSVRCIFRKKFLNGYIANNKY